MKLDIQTVQPLPQNLLRACKYLSDFETHPKRLKYDLLYVILCLQMVESDFMPQLLSEATAERKTDDWLNKMLCSWKSKGRNYTEQFVLNGFTEMDGKLIMVPVGSFVLINFVIKDCDITTFSTCLLLNSYMSIIEDNDILRLVSLDYKSVSVAFKDRVVTPARSAILSQYGYASASLLGLPKEILHKIFIYLDIRHVVNVMKTCHRMRSSGNDSRIWKNLLLRDFTVQEQGKVDKWKVQGEESIDYREKYVKLYAVKTETKILNNKLRTDIRLISDISIQ